MNGQCHFPNMIFLIPPSDLQTKLSPVSTIRGKLELELDYKSLMTYAMRPLNTKCKRNRKKTPTNSNKRKQNQSIERQTIIFEFLFVCPSAPLYYFAISGTSKNFRHASMFRDGVVHFQGIHHIFNEWCNGCLIKERCEKIISEIQI